MVFNTGHCSNHDQFLRHLTEIESKPEISGYSDLVAEFLKNNSEWCQPSDNQLMNRVKALASNEKVDSVISSVLQEAAIQKAKDCADEDPDQAAENIKNYGIKDPRIRIEIARTCLEDGIACIAPHFANFEIPPAFQKELEELLELSAKQDACATVEHFADFKIADETTRIRLIQVCINENGSNIFEHLDSLNITDQQALIGLGIAFAKKWPKKAAEVLPKMPIEDVEQKLKLVAEFMGFDLQAAFDLLNGFGLQGEQVKEIAKEFARREGGRTFIQLGDFHFESPETRNEIRLLCAQSAPQEVLAQFKYDKRQGMDDKEFLAFAKSFLRFNLDALDLFDVTLKETDVKERAMEKWHAATEILKEGMDGESLAWAEPLLQELSQMPSPEERWELTGGLLHSCQDAKSRGAWQELSGKPRLRLLSIPFMELEQAGLSHETLSKIQDRIFASFNNKEKFKDRAELRRLFSTLHRLVSPQHLKAEEIEKVLEQIFQLQDDLGIIKNLVTVRNILLIGGVDPLKKGEKLQEVLLGLFQKLFALQSSERDLSSAMNQLMENEDHLDLLLVYASAYQGMKEPSLMECFGETLKAILEGKFKELRYSFEGNPHLQSLFQGTDLLPTWREPIQYTFTTETEKPFNPAAWLKDYDLNETPQELGKQLRGLKKGSPEQVKVKLKSIMTRLSRMDGSKTADVLRALQDMVEVMKDGGPEYTDLPLFKETEDLQKRLLKPSKPPQELTVKLTDEPFDLLGAGQFADSCLAPSKSGVTNRGLLGIWRSGATQMIGIYDEKGKLLSRCLVRTLLDEPEKNPVILLDNIYPIHGLSDQLKAEMFKAARMKAEQMHWTLLSSKRSGKKYPSPLVSLKGPAPYDYCDGAGSGVKPWGEFKVEDSYYVE